MGQPLKLKGRKFGRLTAIRRVKNTKHGLTRWLCECSCAQKTRKVVRGIYLTSGKICSCGCLQREITSKRVTIHGMSKHPLYDVWSGMIRRCNNPKFHAYYRYGGRGITVALEWKTAANFLRWAMKNGWEKGLQLERRNNDKGYRPDNCCFVTSRKNCRNRRDNRILEFNGVKKCVSEWAEELGIPRGTIKERLRRGWTDEQALSRPVLPWRKSVN